MGVDFPVGEGRGRVRLESGVWRWEGRRKGGGGTGDKPCGGADIG